MKTAEQILEELSPFWAKYVREHTIYVRKEEALDIMETAEEYGFGIELWEYNDKTCMEVLSKDDLGGFYVRLFKDHSEIETRFGEAKTKVELDNLIKLIDVMQIIMNKLEDLK